MVSTASTNALPMNCPWRNKLSPSPRPRRGVHIVKVCPVDNIYLLCYTATCLSSIAGAGYSSPFPSHQGVHTRWFGRALEWHSRGQRFDPAYLHQKHSISFEIECFSILFSLFCAGRFHLGQQMDNRPSQFLLSYCGKEEVIASIKEERTRDKRLSYKFRVCLGRDENGRQISKAMR